MKKILFITTRNVVTTCGELRLIKNRAEALFAEYGYTTDYIALVTKKDKSKCEPMGFDSTLTYFEYSIKNPLTYFTSQKKLLQEIKTKLADNKYDLVIISGSLAFKYVKAVRKIDGSIKVFADVHGAAEELTEFKGKGFVRKARSVAFYKLFKYYEKKYLPKFDDYFVVSKGLKQYLSDQYGVRENIHIVPCAVQMADYTSEDLKQFRKDAREKYRISDDEILFVYSGGVSPWQCIEQTVEIFKQIKLNDTENKCKLLILSGNLEYIRKFEDEYIIIDSLPAHLIPSTLPCADFAFMLREDYVTNNVAYPNKFLEYTSSGLKIIATPFVYDVAEQIKEYDLGYILKDVSFEEELADYCLGNRFEYASDLENRKKLIHDVSFKNRLGFLKKD